MKKFLIVYVALFAFLAAETKAATPESTVKVFKRRGSVQCEPQSGTAPEIMRKELEKAGVIVKSTACGNDGMMYPAMCGSSDGMINIFEIPLAKAAQASTLKFDKLTSLPDTTETPCPQ